MAAVALVKDGYLLADDTPEIIQRAAAHYDSGHAQVAHFTGFSSVRLAHPHAACRLFAVR